MSIALSDIKVPSDWKDLLQEAFLSPYFATIKAHYMTALSNKEVIFPTPKDIFKAFWLTSVDSVKVVILGQDPYHGGEYINGAFVPQAMGLSFSVPKALKIPPSLKNIYKEMAQSLDIVPPKHGDLSYLARQGVLLLNAILSVKANAPTSHRHFGWERFSDDVISALSANKSHIVFMLWGNYAKKKAHLIDKVKHKIITAPHPSPLARGFVGSGVFIEADNYLRTHYKSSICWGDVDE